MYFFALWVFSEKELRVFQTNLPSEKFLNGLLHHSQISVDGDPWFTYGENNVIDTWEWNIHPKLYLTMSQAIGEGKRFQRKHMEHLKRAHRAEFSKKRRKRIQYNIEARK